MFSRNSVHNRDMKDYAYENREWTIAYERYVFRQTLIGVVVIVSLVVGFGVLLSLGIRWR